MKEIEIKLVFDERRVIVNRLKELGAILKEKYLLEDYYYSVKGTNMSNTNDLLRIRKKGNKQELTFKGKCETKGAVWERVEINCPIENYTDILKIFDYLKFNKLSVNKSSREIWILGNCEIVFSDITYPAKVSFLEIEGPSKEGVENLTSLLGGLVRPAGEEIFKKLDDARKNKIC